MKKFILNVKEFSQVVVESAIIELKIKNCNKNNH